MLIRADALLVVVDLNDAPLAQMEDITAQLEKIRIIIGGRKTEEPGIVLYQKKTLIIGSKLDLDNASENYTALKNKYEEQLPVIAISAKEGIGLEELKREIYQMLDIIRVYTKTPGQKPDLNDPIIQTGKHAGGCRCRRPQRLRPQAKICPHLGLRQARWANGKKRPYPPGW